MRLIKKLSMLLVIAAPLSIGCGNNQTSPQAPAAPTVILPNPSQLLPTAPPPVSPPPSSTPGAPVVALIQGWSGPSTGFTITITGTNIPATPIVTFTAPGGSILPAAFVARDQNNPSLLLVGTPNIQALGLTPGVYGLTVTDPSTGSNATGPNMTVQIYANMLAFAMSDAPNASGANHLGSGSDANPGALAFADMNQDGTKDMVTANMNDNSVSVLLRGPSVNPNYSVLNLQPGHATNPTSLAIGDFNADGRQDVVTFSGALTTASKLVSQSVGWSSSVDFDSVQVSSHQAAGVADFNLDGKPDIAVVGTGLSHPLNVLHGDGSLNGGFTNKSYPGFLSDAYGLAVGQFDSDKTRPDLILVGATKIQVVSNQSNPTTGGAATFVAGDSLTLSGGAFPARTHAVADINGDGITDVLVTTQTGKIEEGLSNASNGIWKKQDAATGLYSLTGAMTVGDFNGDGLLDIASLTADAEITIVPGQPSAWDLVPSSVGSNTNLDPLMNRGGKFDMTKAQTFRVCNQPKRIEACDLNGDGLADIAITCQEGDKVQVLTNTSS